MATPEMHVVTSNPFGNSTGIDTTIHDLYLECILAASDSSWIRACFYMFSESSVPPGEPANPTGLLDALRDARDRCNVRVIFDVDHHSDQTRDELADSFNKPEPGVAFFPVHKKTGQGVEGTTKIHDKVLLFSKLKVPNDFSIKALRGRTVRDVVILSSANIYYRQYSQANQTILYCEHPDFYQYHLDLWKRRKADLSHDKFKLSRHVPDSLIAGRVKAYALPRSGDMMVGVLNNVRRDCGSKFVRIRIAIGAFTYAAVADGLAALAKMSNVMVSLVLRPGNVDDAIVAKLKDAGADVFLLEEEPAESGGLKRKVHSKFLLLDSRYEIGGVVKRRQLVWAGSLSYTWSAHNKNGETLVRMEDEGVYRALMAAWNELRYRKSLSGIGAAVGVDGRIYFFGTGKFYVRYEPGLGVRTHKLNSARRRLGVTGWKELPDSFRKGLNAALNHNDHVYLFKGGNYVKWKPGSGLVGGVRTIGVDGWKGMPFTTGVDAALKHPESGAVYFFHGARYCKWVTGQGVVKPAVRTIGKDGWDLPVPFCEGVDAAVTHPVSRKIYFFRGREYCRYKPGKGVDFGPAAIDTHWPGVLFD